MRRTPIADNSVRVNTSGSKSYQVDLGKIDANALDPAPHERGGPDIAQQARAALLGGGLAPFTVPAHVLSEANSATLNSRRTGPACPSCRLLHRTPPPFPRITDSRRGH